MSNFLFVIFSWYSSMFSFDDKQLFFFWYNQPRQEYLSCDCPIWSDFPDGFDVYCSWEECWPTASLSYCNWASVSPGGCPMDCAEWEWVLCF